MTYFGVGTTPDPRKNPKQTFLGIDYSCLVKRVSRRWLVASLIRNRVLAHRWLRSQPSAPDEVVCRINSTVAVENSGKRRPMFKMGDNTNCSLPDVAFDFGSCLFK